MKDLLLNLLKKEQKKHGYLSEEVLKSLSKKTNIPISRLWGIATFYFLLHSEKQGKYVIHVCNSPSCFVNKSLNLIKFLEKTLKIKLDKITKNKKFSLYSTSCIGCCDKAPAMSINNKVYGNLTEEKIKQILKKLK